MVTKLQHSSKNNHHCSVLAKILMVTKRILWIILQGACSVLAKILMVTKQSLKVDIEP